MRSALLCVFFTLIILRRIHAEHDEFKPMPIPLSDWQYYRREGRAGTFHDTIRTESPPAAPAIPPHYWEDALRHSVYLTLVRDKIDQLIAKGEVVSPHSKHGNYDSKEIDDHDLWDKVKTAPFDRIKQDDPDVFGDVTIMAKGRLLENDRGFHFIEDERTKEKCSEDDCMRNVKAFWSVKRVRQRDMETSPGKYNYELTFSVISQKPKKQRKPYENPIRTFTVKESSPNGVLDKPQEYRKFGHGSQTSRPERAIWLHKNISPAKQTGRKHYFHGLDRIFSSFFSDDEEKAFEPPPQKYKQGPFVTPVPPLYPKIGHVGPNEQYQQIPYPYRPQPGKHVRPPLQAPPTYPLQHPYLDGGIITASNPHIPYSHDHRVESSQAIKTTRPAVLPTPLPQKTHSSEVTNMMTFESTENSSLPPETTMVHKTYSKYKPTPAKQNYFSDHVRPPIYNAPPGVFVTMDKKPFKPMPPLKLMHSKTHRPNRPIDFRPSPQITDVQNTDTFADSAFRPITMNFGDISAPEKLEILETTKKGEPNKTRKPTATGKKPPKKHEKPQRTTTATPDIITAQSASEEEIETLDWANILGAFTKTTPMLSQTEKMHITEATTPMTTTTTVTTAKPRSTTTTVAPQETTISTTAKPKRTRPPPKYAKQDKIRKHKRVTTTTTTTSTTTTEVPETQNKKRLSHDLTPQASSAATGIPKPTTSHRELQNKTQTTTSTTTTTTTTTKPTTSKTTITTQSPNTTTKSALSTTQPRNKSRYRQSTLMYKGTSIKHDKWNGVQYNQTVTTTPSASHNHRRKGSNFHGYISSTPRQIVEERERNHADHTPSSSTEFITERIITPTNYDEPLENYETNSVIPLEHTEKEADEDYDDSKDQSEFIFQPTTTQSSLQVISTSHTAAGNKTKCKKKKTNISTTQQPNEFSAETFSTTPKAYTVTTTTSPTETPTTSDILEEFLNFNFNDENEKSNSRGDLQKEESMNHESYLKIDDFEEFLDMHLSDKKEGLHDDQYGDDDNNDDEDENDDDDDEEYENSKIPSIDDDTEFPSEELKHEAGRHAKTEGTEEKRPYTLFELMAMS